MSQQWASTVPDTRTFAQQQARTLDDLNRPNLTNIVTEYLQDAMRYWQRRPFFFTDTDNTGVLNYANKVIVTQGTTIQVSLIINGVPTLYLFVALNAGTTAATGTPAWPSTVFTIPTDNSLPPPPVGTAGTVNDNGIIWANAGTITGGFNSNSQLTTVYSINQYVMPVDLIAFTRVEVTWQGQIRYGMGSISYGDLRDLDVIRPTPPTTYPTMYCWYQEQLYLWPYPVGFYAITLSYRSAPVIAQNAGDSNVWTTDAEALVRHYAEGRISEAVLGDSAMAQFYYDLAQKEFLVLQQEDAQQDVSTGITPDIW